ncbi:MAG: hypothetical protein ACYTHK_02710 [Planctomycetota bacterium]|jgi:hypothetical protein
MRYFALAMLVFVVPGCADEEDEFFEEEPEEEIVLIAEPDYDRAARSADCIDYYAGALPRLIDELLLGDGTILLDWPGGFVVELTIRWSGPLVSFENDEQRDGYRFAGRATIVVGEMAQILNGHVEFVGMGPCDLMLGDWQLQFGETITGKVRVNPGLDANARGTLQFPGDGTAFYSGSYREPGTLSIPAQFVIPLE